MHFSNPVIDQRADPFVYLHSDGYYYFTASVPAYDRIELRRASELADLATTSEIVTAWTKPDTGPYSDLVWAPEIHYILGKWYVYFAAAPSREIKDGAFQHRMYAICNDSDNPLEGEWQFAGQIDSGISSFCLDATYFEHLGEHYYVWAQKDPVIAGNSCLYIAKLASATELASEPVMLSKPEFDWECRGFLVNEGPAILKRNGKVFISYSASATDENYCMGLLSADSDADLLDPANWHKERQPVFSSDESRSIFGPGHNSFTQSKDGKTDFLVYHARNSTEIVDDPLWTPNRHTCIQAFDWDERGFPNFGRPIN
ncbi:glycoside hydrolase family 43 protein [Vibrio sp.]|uniref:glycoside hydrolase family 43 protein n=1 Tax=Vibrio sp. TaxID=678 RepID=UPI003D1303E9